MTEQGGVHDGRLFESLSAAHDQYFERLRSHAARDVLAFPHGSGDSLSHALFSSLEEGGFCTLVVSGRNPWDPTSHYFEAARAAAMRGRQIERAFLLPHRHCRHDPTLREHVELDEAAGISTTVLYVGDLISNMEVPMAEQLDFGLWDNSVGCIATRTASGGVVSPSELRITRRPEDIETLQQFVNTLRSEGESIGIGSDGESASVDLEEPMITSAPLAHEIATVLCRGDFVEPSDCSWYHSSWQYLRIFDMVSTPTWHEEFFLEQLGKLSQQSDCARVLISGTADYSMLAHVMWAYRKRGSSPDVDIVDLCETPLFLCKWYAKLVGTRIRTHAVSIMDHKPAASYDVVTTDAFITRFPPDQRPQLIAAWRDLLRTGGHVVTTVRLEAGAGADPIKATDDQVASFRSRARREAGRWQGFLGTSVEKIENLAAVYARHMTSFALESESELTRLMEDGGFSIDLLQVSDVPGEMQNSRYAEVVATKL